MQTLSGAAKAAQSVITSNPAIRFAIRATVSALIAFSITQMVHAPLQGLWAVLTAVVVLQMSAGGSIRATVDYVLGTFAGAIYASVISILIPHRTELATAAALAVAIAPLAYAAARRPLFRVAPFTALIVLLLAGQFGQGPLAAAAIRLVEVAFGGLVAITVSLVIFPERAYALARRQAVDALHRLADGLPRLLAGFQQEADSESLFALQERIGASVGAVASTISASGHEKLLPSVTPEKAGPLSRTLIRLRHDLVIVGRAAAHPLPAHIGQRLMPLINTAGQNVSRQVNACADGLSRRQAPPRADVAYNSLDACAREIADIRNEGLTRPLSASEVEQVFALGFSLEQLRQHLGDLERCVADWAKF